MNWERKVRKVTPYVPGEQPKEKDIIKLNTNENPYPPAAGVRRAIASFDYDELRLYPSPTAEVLVNELSKYYKVKEDQIFVGVGSDDVLATAFLTFFNSKKPILFPDITYSFYDVWANLYKIPFQTVKLNENFEPVMEDFMVPNGGIVIANPNAPTGIAKDPEWIETILSRNPDSVVIVDEAYVDFGAKSCLPLIEKYDNLLVVQTFSKSRSMAGLRLGVAFGCSRIIKYLSDVKFSINSYTINRPTLAFAVSSLLEDDYFKTTVNRICRTRDWTKEKLKELGFQMTDSKSNFLFVTHPDYAAKDLFDMLRSKKIFVRYFAKPRIDNYLRISVGTQKEMDALLEALREYMRK